MKLFYSPGACSLAPHIVLHESGLAFEGVLASTKTHQLADGSDYYAVNPLGYVPFLVLADGRTLREGQVISQYIADQVPASGLAPGSATSCKSGCRSSAPSCTKAFRPCSTPPHPKTTSRWSRNACCSA